MHCQSSNCKAYSIKNSNYCFRHDPETVDIRSLASIKGGQNRALQGSWGRKVKLNSSKDIRIFLGQVINGVWTGAVPVPVGTSMGFLAKCWLEAHTASEVESRLEEIESRMNKIKT